MITADTYSKDLEELRSKVGELQKDVADALSAVGTISRHGFEDLREETAAGAKALHNRSRKIPGAVMRGTSELETSLEGAVRNQPLLAVALAAGLGVTLSWLISHR